MPSCTLAFFFFFFNDTATTEIYTLSLHDALPISLVRIADKYGVSEISTIIREGGGRMPRFAQLGSLAIEALRSEEHTSELQSQSNLVCRLLLEKKKKRTRRSPLDAPRRLSS